MENYVVFDLEWNQSPDGKDGSVEAFPFEIIEIGAVKMDRDFNEVSQFHCLVKPQVYQQMHYKITEVTHMSMEELEKGGKDFGEAVLDFLKWCGKDCRFCTWGSMDLTELQRNMAYFNVPIPFSKPLFYYDVQKLYSLLCGDGRTRLSLDTAVEELGMDRDQSFHRALCDAGYTAGVMKRLDFLEAQAYLSVDYYTLPETKEEEIYMMFPSYSKYVSRGFETKEEAVADKTVTDMLCHKCNRMLRKKVRWFSYNQRSYYALAVCPEHGFVRGKIRIKKGENGLIHALKTMKLVGEDGARLIQEQNTESQKKRVEKNRVRKLKKKTK